MYSNFKFFPNYTYIRIIIINKTICIDDYILFFSSGNFYWWPNWRQFAKSVIVEQIPIFLAELQEKANLLNQIIF